MRHLGTLALATLALLVAACGDAPDPAPSPEPVPQASSDVPPVPQLPPDIDFARLDPPAYLKVLEEHAGILLTVGSAPKGWITEAHVEELLDRIDDDAPAAVTVAIVSSYIPFGETSTVGREALFLIQGFREGFYPSAICSVGYFDPDPEATRRWWAERNQKR